MAFSEFWFCPYLHIFPLFHKKDFDSIRHVQILLLHPAHLTSGFLSGRLLYPNPQKGSICASSTRDDTTMNCFNPILSTRDKRFVCAVAEAAKAPEHDIGWAMVGDLYWTLHGARDGLFQDSRVFARTGYQRRTRHSLGGGNMDVGD